MSSPRIEAALDQLYRDVGFRPLSHWWGRVEMMLGLLAMAAGTFGMILIAPDVVRSLSFQSRAPVEFEFPYAYLIGSFGLFVLGAYMAMSGHRRHLYESADKLTAYLADVIRSQGVAAPPSTPAADGRLQGTPTGV